MTDMEISSDAGRQRLDDDEDLIEIDFDLPSYDPLLGLQDTADHNMVDDYREDTLVDMHDHPEQDQEQEEAVMGEADQTEGEAPDHTYEVNVKEMPDDMEDEALEEVENEEDVDLIDTAPDDDTIHQFGHEEQRLATTSEAGVEPATEIDLTRVATYPIYVTYADQNWPLLPSSTDTDPQYPVLQKSSQIQAPLEDLFSACKDMLGEAAEGVTLVLEFSSIGLTIDECSIYKNACSLYSILDVYIGLCENEAKGSEGDEAMPLFIALYTQPSFWTRFEELRDGRQAGSGLSRFDRSHVENEEEKQHIEQSGPKLEDAQYVEGEVGDEGGVRNEAEEETFEDTRTIDDEGAAKEKQQGKAAGDVSEASKYTEFAPETADPNIASESGAVVEASADHEEAGGDHQEGNTDWQREHADDGHNGDDASQQNDRADAQHTGDEEPEQADIGDTTHRQIENNEYPGGDHGLYEDTEDPENPELAQLEPHHDFEAGHQEFVDQAYGVGELQADNADIYEQDEEDIIDYSDEELDPPMHADANGQHEQNLEAAIKAAPVKKAPREANSELQGHPQDASDGVNKTSGAQNVDLTNIHEAKEDLDNGGAESQLRYWSEGASAKKLSNGEEDEEDELDLGSDDECADEENDSENTLGRDNDHDQSYTNDDAQEPAAADDKLHEHEEETETSRQETSEKTATGNTRASDQAYEEDDSWLTGLDDVDEQAEIPTADKDEVIATHDELEHNGEYTADFDDASSINSFSGDVLDAHSTPSKAAPTSTPMTTPSGTLLNIPPKTLNRKRSRADLEDAAELDLRDSAESKKARSG